MSVQVTSGQCACLFYFLSTSCPQGQQTYLPLRMFDYVVLGPTVMTVTATRDEQACCSTHVLNVALNQQACLLQLHPTTWHVGYN